MSDEMNIIVVAYPSIGHHTASRVDAGKPRSDNNNDICTPEHSYSRIDDGEGRIQRREVSKGTRGRAVHYARDDACPD